MNKLLEKAFKKASKLPRKAQDALGACLLEELDVLEDEARWDATFTRTQEQLGRWADEALAEIEAGEVEPLCSRKRR